MNKSKQVGKYKVVQSGKRLYVYDNSGKQVKHNVYEKYQKERLQKQRESGKKSLEKRKVRRSGRFISKDTERYLVDIYERTGKRGQELVDYIQEKIQLAKPVKDYPDLTKGLTDSQFSEIESDAILSKKGGEFIQMAKAERVMSAALKKLESGIEITLDGKAISIDDLQVALQEIVNNGEKKVMETMGVEKDDIYWTKFRFDTGANHFDIKLPAQIFITSGQIDSPITSYE